MPLKILDNILDISSKIFKFKDDIEISLEANPSSYEREKFRQMHKLGINRISIGVQSLNDKNSLELDVSNLIQGIYFINVKSGTVSQTKQFVKN